MPIPEPSARRPSVLYTTGADGKPKPASKEQRAAELAAVYGANMSTASLVTQGEIERMRQIVRESDSKNTNGISTIDLNNPPKDPYQHQKFPMLVYNHAKSKPAGDELKRTRVGGTFVEEVVHVPAKYHTVTVKDDKELTKALAAGFKETPPVPVQVDPLEEITNTAVAQPVK